jgi:hypothetical protein
MQSFHPEDWRGFLELVQQLVDAESKQDKMYWDVVVYK